MVASWSICIEPLITPSLFNLPLIVVLILLVNEFSDDVDVSILSILSSWEPEVVSKDPIFPSIVERSLETRKLPVLDSILSNLPSCDPLVTSKLSNLPSVDDEYVFKSVLSVVTSLSVA